MKSLLFNGVVFCLETAARVLLALNKPKIIAVTGSVGKTSTKLATAQVLSSKYLVLAQKGSYNSETGVPLSLFELESPSPAWNPFAWVWIFLRIAWKLVTPYPYQIVVQEIGADKPGDIKRILRYITPEIGVVTAVHSVHTELFGSLENIFKEKSLVALKSKRAVINGDDTLLRERLLSHLTIPTTTYGIEKDASWKPSGIERNEIGELTMVFGDTVVQTHMVARHGLYALLAAGAVGEIFGIEKMEIYKQLSVVQPASGRMRVLEGKNGSTLLDDSYNASPGAVVRALETLREFPGLRKIAVLGSMNELGEMVREGHERVGDAVAQEGVDLLVTIGENANTYLAASAMRGGLLAESCVKTKSPAEAGKYVARILRQGDVVLVKGSQNGVFSEEALALMLKNSGDRKNLVRQSSSWMAVKRKQFKDIA